ncbi:MAG: PPOX class F420-dependent oxidoreductase [Hyphomicrobiales bacterium]|jgi:PPOX class probable F420-dependent enzyme|nr:PPOX class F420-dependent oxidoreductase [Hyphomicrobiales bacterium]MCO5082284.1 PPOX class F420-dependent oxidoreductase [Rhizobiaceae bacterium]
MSLPENWKTILKQPVLVHFTTVMADGSPQTSPVWVDVEGDDILINSAVGRVKDKNVRRDPRVAVSAVDPDNAYRALMVRGRVIDITTEGAEAQIDALAKKYIGQDTYPWRRPGEVRVTYRIRPEKIGTMG